MFQFATKRCDVQAQRGAGSLHPRLQHRGIHAEYQRCAQHALIADHRQFEVFPAVDRHQLRNETIERKIDVADALIRLPEYVTNRQFDLTTSCNHVIAVFPAKGGQQPIVLHETDYPCSGQPVCTAANISRMQESPSMLQSRVSSLRIRSYMSELNALPGGVSDSSRSISFFTTA